MKRLPCHCAYYFMTAYTGHSMCMLMSKRCTGICERYLRTKYRKKGASTNA